MNISLQTISRQQLQELLMTTPVLYGYHQVPTGTLFTCIFNNHVITAVFCDTSNNQIEQEILKNYPHAQPCEEKKFATLIQQTPIHLLLAGTQFQNQVWQAASTIHAGTTVTYQHLATLISHPKAYRAVANALAQNSIAYFIPCHRIIRTNGALGGYKWGIQKKIDLIKHELKAITSR